MSAISEFGDPISALAEIQATVIELRRMADETRDLRKRDACLRIADAIERHARKLDQRGAS